MAQPLSGMPKIVEKENGDKVEYALPEELRELASPLIIDVRDLIEVEGKLGGEPLPGSVNVPLNMDGVKQSERATTLDEFRAKLDAAGCLPEDKATGIITHCKGGGRGFKSAVFLREMGYTNVHNGGGPSEIRAALAGT